MNKAIRGLLVVSMLVLLATVVEPVGVASAQTTYIAVPAVAFHLGANTSYNASFGAVQANGSDVVRAEVYFSTFGRRVCRLTMWARDPSDNNVTGRLVRKRTQADGSESGPAPETIASVSSTGLDDALRRFDTTVISQPVIAAAYNYWVELDFSGGTIHVIGLRIQIDDAC
jgi:hypothetical protein